MIRHLTDQQTEQLLEKLHGIAKGLGVPQPELHATVALSMLEQVATGVVHGVIESALVSARLEAEQQRTRAEAAEDRTRKAVDELAHLEQLLRDAGDDVAPLAMARQAAVIESAREEAEQQRTRAEAAEAELHELRDVLGREVEPTAAGCPSTADMPREDA